MTNRMTISTPSLQGEVKRYQWLRQQLVAKFAGLDEETLQDTLEGITDLQEMIASIIRSALVDEALHEGLRRRLNDMKERLSRIEIRAGKKRELALGAMIEAGIDKIEQPDFTASVRAGAPSIVLIAEDSIPAAYWLPQPPRLDRQSILVELKGGVPVPGAELSNPNPVLMVRTK